MRLVARFKDFNQIKTVSTILYHSRTTEREFAKAAILFYCDHLIKRAKELHAQAEAKTELETLKAEVSNDRNVEGNTEPAQLSQDVNSSALAQSESPLADAKGS